jgi:hypothetical protein
MSAKKHKRKAVKHVTHQSKKITSPSVLSHYPRIFLALSLLLVVLGVLLLTIGYVSAARVGLSMIVLFFGLVLGMFANSALPKRGTMAK